MRSTANVFTSGSTAGLGCEFNPGWCSSKTPVYSNFSWAPGFPNNLLGNRAICLNLVSGKFWDCSENVIGTFICEVNNNMFLIKYEQCIKI